jgi:hypothetical protein
VDHLTIENHENLLHSTSPIKSHLHLILKRLDSNKDSFQKFKSIIELQIESMWSRLKSNQLKNESNQQKQKTSMFFGKLPVNEKESSRINGVW